jgi:hypothetical protein
MRKSFRIGYLETYNKPEEVWVSVRWDGQALSIEGIIGPRTHSAYAMGQIILEFKEYNNEAWYTIQDIKPARGWNHEMIAKLFEVWDKYHLNDVRNLEVPAEVIEFLENLPATYIPQRIIEWFMG